MSVVCLVSVRVGSNMLGLVCVATSDMAQTGEIDGIGALGVGVTSRSPAARSTKVGGVGQVVSNIDDQRVGGFSSKVLEGTLAGAD